MVFVTKSIIFSIKTDDRIWIFFFYDNEKQRIYKIPFFAELSDETEFVSYF